MRELFICVNVAGLIVAIFTFYTWQHRIDVATDKACPACERYFDESHQGNER